MWRFHRTAWAMEIGRPAGSFEQQFEHLIERFHVCRSEDIDFGSMNLIPEKDKRKHFQRFKLNIFLLSPVAYQKRAKGEQGKP